jgi:hypothetical protein
MALPDQGMVQSNFGMEEQRRIAGLEAMFGQGIVSEQPSWRQATKRCATYSG